MRFFPLIALFLSFSAHAAEGQDMLALASTQLLAGDDAPFAQLTVAQDELSGQRTLEISISNVKAPLEFTNLLTQGDSACKGASYQADSNDTQDGTLTLVETVRSGRAGRACDLETKRTFNFRYTGTTVVLEGMSTESTKL